MTKITFCHELMLRQIIVHIQNKIQVKGWTLTRSLLILLEHDGTMPP